MLPGQTAPISLLPVIMDTGPPAPNKKGSFLSTASETISIMIAANELRNIADADVLIRSDLKGYSSMMFNDSASIIPKGFAGAGKLKPVC